MPENWTITITKDNNGNLQYTSGGGNAKEQHVNPADTVSWTSPDGQIAILFKSGGTPFECKQTAFAADMDEATPPRKIKKLTGPKPARMSHHYTVVHQDVNDAPVTDDPDLVVDDPGGDDAGGGGGARSAATTKAAATPAKKVVKPVAKKTAKRAAPKKRGK